MLRALQHRRDAPRRLVLVHVVGSSRAATTSVDAVGGEPRDELGGEPRALS